MSASQFKYQPLSSSNSESHSSWPEDPQTNSAASVIIQLGVALARPNPPSQDPDCVIAVETFEIHKPPARNTRTFFARQSANRSSFTQRWRRSRSKIAFAFRRGWKAC